MAKFLTTTINGNVNIEYSSQMREAELRIKGATVPIIKYYSGTNPTGSDTLSVATDVRFAYSNEALAIWVG